jgi:hypothetical protein
MRILHIKNPQENFVSLRRIAAAWVHAREHPGVHVTCRGQHSSYYV